MSHIENSKEYKGLTVNQGVEQPPMVNPYLTRRVKRRQFSVNDYVEGILAGNRSILSQAVTLVESLLPEHHTIAQEVIEKCLPHAGKSIRLGITGVPGAGKSTLVRCINGLETVDSGEILFKDKVICSNDIKINKEDLSKISMIFQSFNLLEQKNVIEV